ncbi:MAG: nitrous oxide-stimulated promoter family protein [Bacillota bacterium]
MQHEQHAIVDKDIKILVDFIRVFCKENHSQEPKEILEGTNVKLCNDCMELALYAIKKRQQCRKDPKPACKKCDTPCYAPKYKAKIREVMKFSGKYFVLRGRLDYLYHYFS